MSADKLVTIFGAAGVVEASYDAGGSPSLGANGDGILLTEPTTFSRSYFNVGNRSMAPSGMGVLPRQAPSGPTGNVALPVEAKGAGAAYSASVKPDFHNLLRIAGHSATGDFTASAEKYTYAPESWDGTVPPNLASGYFDLYGRGERYSISGCYANVQLAVEDGGIGLFTFDVFGRPAAPVEVTLPSITYLTTVPPKGDDLTFQVGNFTGGKVRSLLFNQNREIVERSVYGYSAGKRAPTLQVTWEQPALAASSPWNTATTFNAEKLWEESGQLQIDFTIGSVQYNRVKFQAPTAVISNVEYGEDGPVALQTVTWELAQSDGATPDDYSIIVD